jgi:hypothetical protein
MTEQNRPASRICEMTQGDGTATPRHRALGVWQDVLRMTLIDIAMGVAAALGFLVL